MYIKNTPNIINYTLNCKGKLYHITRPIVMGIINITPDSYYAPSQTHTITHAVQQAVTMVQQGATIIDVGAQSTRPGSTALSWEQEWARLQQPLQAIVAALPHTIISVDTYYSQVANQAIAAGASIVNDISGGSLDAHMLATVAALQVPYVCTHIQGTPQSMQLNPTYDDVVQEVLDFFIHKTLACTQAGIHDVILDVGFGFGKTISHNYELLSKLNIFNNVLGNPILVGLSRKSMVYKPLGITPELSLAATSAIHMAALQHGATILRVHDVAEAMQVITLWNMLQHA